MRSRVKNAKRLGEDLRFDGTTAFILDSVEQHPGTVDTHRNPVTGLELSPRAERKAKAPPGRLNGETGPVWRLGVVP